MLVVRGLSTSDGTMTSVWLITGGHTTVLTSGGGSSGYPFHTGTTVEVNAFYQNYSTNFIAPKARWRASKGSAPVGRFTRAFGDNNTEGWHRTMPIATSTTVTVAVPAVFLRDIAVTPAVSAGTTAVAAPVTTIRLVAIAPAVSQATQIAVPPSRLTLNAVAPARTTTVTLAVTPVAVRNLAITPTVVPGTRTLTPAPVAVRLAALEPTVFAGIAVPPAVVTLLAVAPTVTGGGGVTPRVLPRAGGDGRGSVTKA